MGSINFDDHLLNHISSYKPNPLDPEEFRRQGHMMIDFIADYYKNVEKYPVLSQVKPGYLPKLLPKSAPNNPEPIETILQDVQDHIIPGITHWQSPNFFAYFQITSSTAGFLGEMLCTALNVVPFNWISSPAGTELENIVIDWLGEMLQLPKSFLFSGNGGGVLHSTTCEAIVCALVAARDQMLSRTGIGRENTNKLVVYGSDQTHSTLQKAAQIVGIHPKNFRAIKTNKSTLFALSPDSVRAAISKDIEAGLIPLFLCATVGTTSTTAVDPIGSLCEVAKDYGMWIHVDAAYAGSACICPEFRHFMDGIEGANSLSLNAHKWFLTGLDCCCVWVKDPRALTKSLSTSPEYLKNEVTDSKQVVEYKDWQIGLSRRFRALRLWFVLRSHGVDNLRSYLRNHVKMAKHVEGLIAMDKRFEIVIPRKFALICFRLLPPPAPAAAANGHGHDHDLKKVQNGHDHVEDSANDLNRKLLDSINKSGHVFMTHAIVGGVYLIRFAVGATLAEKRHVINAWKVIQEHADAIFTTY